MEIDWGRENEIVEGRRKRKVYGHKENEKRK
jgi:hypothetical protein